MGKIVGPISKADRLKLGESLKRWIDDRIIAPDGDLPVVVSVRDGVEMRDNWTTGMREASKNGTSTLSIEINGGAADTEGKPIYEIANEP